MKIKNIYISSLLLVASLVGTTSCNDFLERDLQGTSDEGQTISPDNVDNLVIAAYAHMVSGEDMNSPFSLWPYGNVRADDAYKGGANSEDGSHFHFLEIATGMTTDNWAFDDIWYRLYSGVARANAALKSLDGMDANTYPQKDERIGEMRFLRGHYMFLLKVMFKHIVYVDETIPTSDYTKISNRQYTNDQLWQKIADDFKFAYDHLPDTQVEKGRPTQAAASAYLAKVMLYKAYRQNEKNEVIEINEDDLKAVITYTDNAIMTAGGFGLEEDFAYNFLPQYENGKESIWAVQYSQDDNTMYGNLNFGNELTAPQFFGCCDFQKPSQNLVNAFRTENGRPMFDTYNEKDNYDVQGNYDPRLFHTVAIPGFPYKYNVNYIFDKTWTRNEQEYYGLYSSLKENVDPDCSCLKKVNSPFVANSMNRIVLRYADVVLMRAEALIQLNRLSEALPLVNEIRNRAARSTTLVFDYGASFKVEPYTMAEWTDRDIAMRDLKWERRLELALEGSRFFDLVRWGDAAKVMNQYYASEASRRSYYSDANFTAGKNEYLPIPQKQINYSGGLYQQNNGWEK